MMRALVAIRDLLVLLEKIVIRLSQHLRKRDAAKAIKDSEDAQSQKPLEEHISGTSGRPSKHKYLRMFTRKKKT